MRKLLLFLCIASLQEARANDGVFYATGNTLIPLKETSIRLKKEILNLERKGDWMQVDIYFEFFNPGPEKELTVGFVTPPAEGDVGEEDARHPYIKDFMVMVGDKLLPYRVAQLKETGFKVDLKVASGYDFVYYFKIKFLKGLTVIRHSYLYRGGASVEAKVDFNYRLTTGTTWANSAIEDFELNVNFGDDSYFAVPAGFGATTVNWTIIGIGRLSAPVNFNPYDEMGGGAKLRMAYLRKGKLQLRASNFKPQKDLALIVFQLHNEVKLWCDKGVKNDFADIMELVWGDSVEIEVAKLSDLELRLYRNLNYARMGYDFKEEALKILFSKYNWYIPDPAVKPENVPGYYVTKELQQLILAEEKRRKIKTDIL